MSNHDYFYPSDEKDSDKLKAAMKWAMQRLENSPKVRAELEELLGSELLLELTSAAPDTTSHSLPRPA